MAITTRPVDVITDKHLLIGMPFVEFALSLTGGGFGVFRTLGIVDSAEIAKELELIELNSSQSGTTVLVRELVRKLKATLPVGIFNFDENNMQLFFASDTITAVAASTPTVTDDPFNLTTDPLDFVHLAKQKVVSISALSPAQILSEAVGTGTGTPFGETLGDFALDFKVLVVADVTSYLEGGTERVADIVSGGAPAATKIGITEGAVADSGKIIYPTGEGPTSGDAIIVTYEPSFAFALGDQAAPAAGDFQQDLNEGRVQVFFTSPEATTDTARANQPFEATYTHTESGHDALRPFTQFVFDGKARVRLLTDVGINLIWNIPKASVRLTDDAFAFNRDEFAIGNLIINLLDNGGTTPFGTLEVYDETP